MIDKLIKATLNDFVIDCILVASGYSNIAISYFYKEQKLSFVNFHLLANLDFFCGPLKKITRSYSIGLALQSTFKS